jgi:hydrogenase maturation protease
MIDPPPVLVLGLGNLLLGDDAVGLHLKKELEAALDGSAVEFVDGGTQGIALVGYFADRPRVLILDAISLGEEPGFVHVLRGNDLAKLRARRATNAHEGNGLTLIEMARLLGYYPEELAVVGVEPAQVRTGIGLSAPVTAALDRAFHEARKILEEFSDPSLKEPVYVSGCAWANR